MCCIYSPPKSEHFTRIPLGFINGTALGEGYITLPKDVKAHIAV